MVERGIGRALRGDRFGIVGEAAGGDGGGVDHGDDAVDRERGADLRPVERLDQRLRQRQARGLDDDVLGRRLACEQALRCAGTKSSATVQQMQPLASSMMLSSGQVSTPQPCRMSPSTPTSPNSLMISASRRPCGMLEQVADQRRLAGAEKAGDDRDGDLAKLCSRNWS